MDFSKTELPLYDGPDCPQLYGMDGAPKYGSGFDLDLGVSLTNKDEGFACVGRLIQMFEPGMSMPVCVSEEEPLYLHTLAFPQELRAEIG